MANYEGQYNPKLVTCIVSGPLSALGAPIPLPALPAQLKFPLTIVGRAADNFFNVTNSADMVSLSVGADGAASFVINNDESGNFTINTTRGTRSNQALSILFRAQRLIGEGQLPPFTFGVSIRDNNATPPTTHQGFKCLILRQPDDAFGAGDGTIAWGFLAAQVVSNFSGRIG